MLDPFANSVRFASRLFGIAAAGLLASAVIVVCQMVVMRYFLRASTVWQTEYVTFALVAATFIGAPYVALRKGHVNVDLLPMYLGNRGRLLLALLASGASMLFSALLGWKGFELLEEAWTGGWRTETIWALPLWIPYLSLPLGFGLMALQYLADVIALLRGQELPFGMEREYRP